MRVLPAIPLPVPHAVLLSAAALGFTACHPAGPPLVKAKVIALSPAEYAGKKLSLEGKVVEAGAMGAYFILEDDTGRTFVSGASVDGRINCGKDSVLSVIGEPKRHEGQVYFDAEKVVTCSR